MATQELQNIADAIEDIGYNSINVTIALDTDTFNEWAGQFNLIHTQLERIANALEKTKEEA